jgi:hypothetical protein
MPYLTATLGTSYASGATGSAIDVYGAKFLTFLVTITDKSSATRLDAQPQVSYTGGADDAEWTPLLTESESSGTATYSPYEGQRSGVDSVTAPQLFLALPLEIRAYPYMRLRLKADAGTPAVTVEAVAS